MVRENILLIRADATTQIGTGHIMRCLALAQAWQAEGGTAQFVVSNIPNTLQTRLSTENVEVITISAEPNSSDDAIQTVTIAKQCGAKWLVIDGYQFDAIYQHLVKQAGLFLLFVDDYGHATHYYADIVLNQNIYASEAYYLNREPYTALLLGTDYTLLRCEFWAYQGWKRKPSPYPTKILVTLGGVDTDNVTSKIIQALQQLDIINLEVIVVVGGSNPHYSALESQIANQQQIQLVKNVNNMPKLMTWADITISAGGSTCWELAFMGLPNLIIILAKNQCLVAEGLDRVGVATNLGWHHNLSSEMIATAVFQFCQNPQRLSDMSNHGRQYIDGMGGKRVVRELNGRLSKV